MLEKLSMNDSLMLPADAGDLLSLRFLRSPGKSVSAANMEGGAALAGMEQQQEEKKQSLGKIALVGDRGNGGIFGFRRRPSLVYVPLGSLDTTELTLQIDQRCLLDFTNLAIRFPHYY